MKNMKELRQELNIVRTHKKIIENHFTIDNVPAKDYQKLQEKDDIITGILNSFNSIPVGRV